MRYVLKPILLILSSGIAALTLAYWLQQPTNRILAQWQQPNSVKYDAFDPYYFSIVEGGLDWQYLPLSWQRHHSLYVGRDRGKPSYGHFLEFSFHSGVSNLSEHLKQSKVTWTGEGVTFNEASGHRVFIPNRMFVGGR